MNRRPNTPEARAAQASWARQRRRLAAYGRWDPFVDAGPVRDHLAAVHATGMPYRELCAAVGISHGALDYVMWGDHGRQPARRVRRELADAVLAYWPKLEDYPDGARIDACGTRRRLQALLLLGFPFGLLRVRTGVSQTVLKRSLDVDRVTVRVARAVRAVYDELWSSRPEDHGVRADVAAGLRRYWKGHGFVPALAWDDDTIDDPAAVPAVDAARPAARGDEEAVNRWLMGESVILTMAGERAALRYLMEWTALSPSEIGARFGVDGESVTHRWKRIRQQAKTAGEPEPWRRVYVDPHPGAPAPAQTGRAARAARAAQRAASGNEERSAAA